MRFVMRQKLLSLAVSFSIKDEGDRDASWLGFRSGVGSPHS